MFEIDIATIHHVEGTGFEGNFVEHVDVMHLVVGDVNEGGDRAMQIEQRVHFDSGLMLAESGPWKKRQTKIDGR